MPDFLDTKRSEIAGRLGELKPAVEEYERLETALVALEAVTPRAAESNGQSAPAKPKRQRTPKVAAETEAPKRSRGRPKGTGKRDAEALAIVRAEPGVTVAQIAERMGMKPNYLYRLLPRLAEEGHVVKDGKGWKPVETEAVV